MRRFPGFFGLFVWAVAFGAAAQVPGIPSLGGPALPTRAATDALGRSLADPLPRVPLEQLRRLQVQDLVRSERRRLDVDPRGEPVLRGEFLAIALDAGARAAVGAAGFVIEREPGTDDALDLGLVVLRDTRSRRAGPAMRELQRAAPSATFAFQHVYLAAGPAGAAGRATPALPANIRIGLVDGGVDGRDPAMAGVRIVAHGCPSPVPSPHGTAVAARLLGGSRGTLYAADLWCGDRVGRATLGLVEALAWLARERVAVINISLVGPDNPVLARAVQAMLARGHVLVAAVGNDGPAAPPLYPAAYAGVIGVSAVDGASRVLPESGSGPHVAFSAPGVVGEGRHVQRGTSFAAPVVARFAATLVYEPAPGAGAHVQATLAAQARDLGKPGRDPRYGIGLIGGAP